RREEHAVEDQCLLTVIENHPTFCHLISERQMGTWWMTMLGLLNAGKESLAKACVKDTFTWFLQFHGTDQIGLPDPYQPYRAAMGYHLGLEETESEKIYNMNYQSYLLPLLLKLISELGLRDCLAAHWKDISRMQVREYMPSNTEELLGYRLPSGQTT